MKWIPISELSDEQKDGRWWIFLGTHTSYLFQAQFDKEESVWYDIDGDTDEPKSYSFFLSEPLPDIPKPKPKPKPFEVCWIDVNDRLPEKGKIVYARIDTGRYIEYINGLIKGGVWELAQRPADPFWGGKFKVTHWMPLLKDPIE